MWPYVTRRLNIVNAFRQCDLSRGPRCTISLRGNSCAVCTLSPTLTKVSAFSLHMLSSRRINKTSQSSVLLQTHPSAAWHSLALSSSGGGWLALQAYRRVPDSAALDTRSVFCPLMLPVRVSLYAEGMDMVVCGFHLWLCCFVLTQPLSDCVWSSVFLDLSSWRFGFLEESLTKKVWFFCQP